MHESDMIAQVICTQDCSLHFYIFCHWVISKGTTKYTNLKHPVHSEDWPSSKLRMKMHEGMYVATHTRKKILLNYVRICSRLNLLDQATLVDSCAPLNVQIIAGDLTLLQGRLFQVQTCSQMQWGFDGFERISPLLFQLQLGSYDPLESFTL